jgi:peptide/nickel transport system permease protein
MKTSRIGLRAAQILAAVLCSAAVFSDFLSTSPATMQNLSQVYAPPTRIHFVDKQGAFHLRPFICRYELTNPLDLAYVERRETPYPLEFFRKGYTYDWLGLIPSSLHLVGGTDLHPLGTDDLGHDLFARLLAGARTSLIVVLAGVCIYAAIGLAIGSLAGLLGGWVDSALMRLSEFVLALPALYLILALRALMPMRMPFWQMLLLNVGIIAGVAWPPMARGVRGLIFQLRSAGYVEAARAIGCTRWQILTRHMLPALPPFVVTQAALAAPIFLLGEVVLSFLDVGFRDAAESWGTMLRSLRDPRVLTDFQWNLAPLALVFATLFCLNVLSNRVRADRDLVRI